MFFKIIIFWYYTNFDQNLIYFLSITIIQSYWLITQKLFLGSGTEKILYTPSKRALKMMTFDSNIR